jgi:hypothetical protein
METSVLILKLDQAKRLVDECLNSLRDGGAIQPERTAATPASSPSPVDIDFSTPARPFMKAFVALSGAKKFVLLLAWMAKGDLEKEIALSEIESLWDSMSGMLNLKFNRKFTSDAKDANWAESRKVGFYSLRPNWKQVLS